MRSFPFKLAGLFGMFIARQMTAARGFFPGHRTWLQARVLPTVIAFVVLAYLVGPGEVASHIRSVSMSGLLFSLVLHGAVIAALSWRWLAVVRTLGARVAYREALRLTFTATFLNMVLPTSVGGDVGRVWLGRRHGVGLSEGAIAAVCDRVVGLASLLLLVACAIFFLPHALPVELQLVLPMMLLGLVAGVFVLRYAHRLAPGSHGARATLAVRSLLRCRGLVAAAVMVSVLGHIAAAGIAAVIAQGMGLELSFAMAIVLFPAVMLATLVPISVGGWGVRELAAIPLLGLAGVEPAGATAIALTFGLTQLIAAGLGTSVLLLARERAG
jgi:glycosyltransferase 2 family protein